MHALIYLSCHHRWSSPTLLRGSCFPEEVLSRDDLRLFSVTSVISIVLVQPSELLCHVEVALLDLALEADDVDLEEVDAVANLFLEKGGRGSLIFYNNICTVRERALINKIRFYIKIR